MNMFTLFCGFIAKFAKKTNKSSFFLFQTLHQNKNVLYLCVIQVTDSGCDEFHEK